MAMLQTICYECWKCKQKCAQYIQSPKYEGFKRENCKEDQARNTKAD